MEGGSKLDLKVTWFEPMTFADGLYSLRIPFVFHENVLPLATHLASITKIRCSINTGTKDPVEVGTFANPMKVCTNRITGLGLYFLFFNENFFPYYFTITAPTVASCRNVYLIATCMCTS